MQISSIALSEIFLRKLSYEKGDANWIHVLPTKTKQYNNRIHSSIKSLPTQASLENIEGYVYQNFWDKRKKIRPKKTYDLARTAVLKKTFSKGHTTNWPYKLHGITDIVFETIPSYCIGRACMVQKSQKINKERSSSRSANNLPGHYNEVLPKRKS